MHITFAPRGILQIDDARLIYRNFSGAPSQFNREGDRDFHLVIPDREIADALVEEGWNVKIKPARNEEEDDFMTMKVKVKFNGYGPKCYLVSGNRRVELDEQSVGMLDEIDIETCDLDIRSYDWEMNGKTGRTAYLQSIEVTQRLDRFAERFANTAEE